MSIKQKNWMKFKKFKNCGDWQLHTNFTDGNNSIEEIFQRAEENNLCFIFFSEHVRRRLNYNFADFKDEVYRLGSKSNIDFAVGAEAKVLDTNGNIDISEDTFDLCEMVSFAFHQHNFVTKKEYLLALVKTIRNEKVDIWAHPTSYHNELNFNIKEDEWLDIFDEMVKNNVCYEINKRYPPLSKLEKRLLSENDEINLVYSSDAHDINDILTLEEIKNMNLRR